MLPLYTPFMTAERRETIRRDMRGEGGGSIHARLGILTSGLNVKFLRFCPACVKEDREPYWHRVHQAPGVEVCPTHAVFLSESAVNVRNRSMYQAFMTVKQVLDETSPAGREIRPLDLDSREHEALLRLAKDAAWLLKARVEIHDLNLLRKRYQHLLHKQGLASFSGKVAHARVQARFLDHYSPELLGRLGCGLELRYHWLRRLINDWKRARHPLHHLLLIQFLGCSAEEFFRLPIVEPFGNGPWPCLNVVGGHYRENRIVECQIGSMTDGSRRPSGTFGCECGFTYRRCGVDASDERRYESDLIMSFGEVWYEKLRELLAKNSSREEMAEVLGVSILVVKGEVRRLKKSIKSGMPLAQRYQHPRIHSVQADPEMRDRQRTQWLEVTAANPNDGRNMLASKASYSYHWLFKYDKEWLRNNFPERLESRGRKTRTDWSERDKTYSSDVRNTAASMLTAPGRPVWVSRTGILKKLGILTLVNKNSAKLPLTSIALNEVSESVEVGAIRRIHWAADCYRQEQVLATGSRLLSRAGVSDLLMRDPNVKVAVMNTARLLRELSETGWEVSAKESGEEFIVKV